MLYAIYDKDEGKVVEIYATRKAARHAKKFLKLFGRDIKIIKVKKTI